MLARWRCAAGDRCFPIGAVLVAFFVATDFAERRRARAAHPRCLHSGGGELEGR